MNVLIKTPLWLCCLALGMNHALAADNTCLLYTSDAADE